MNSKMKLVTLVLVSLMMSVMVQCGTSGGGGGGHNGRSWLDIARFIDSQLGDVSDGTTATCGGNALADYGDHCKNQLKGTMDAEMISQATQVAWDIILPSDFTSLGDRNILFRHGFNPQTADPCNEDVNLNDTLDFLEVCAGGATQIACTGLGNYDYEINYTDCVEGAYVLDGSVRIQTVKSGRNELLVIGSSDNYRESQTGVRSFLASGHIVRYQILDPVTNGPALGSQRHYPDGMEIYKLDVMVDTDGDTTDDVGPNELFFANDFEDGVVILKGDGNAVYVWVEMDATNVIMQFYDVDLPRNGNELGVDTGCDVQIPIASMDPVNRTFDYTSTGNCLESGTDVPF